MAFGSRLKHAEIIQSVGKPASCWDKIVAESFLATLKKKRVYRGSWPLRRTLEMEIFEYIEIFYNRPRRHSRLGNISPGGHDERYCSVAKRTVRGNGSCLLTAHRGVGVRPCRV